MVLYIPALIPKKFRDAVVALVSHRCCPSLLPLRLPAVALAAVACRTCDLNHHQISADEEGILDFEFHLWLSC